MDSTQLAGTKDARKSRQHRGLILTYHYKQRRGATKVCATPASCTYLNLAIAWSCGGESDPRVGSREHSPAAESRSLEYDEGLEAFSEHAGCWIRIVTYAEVYHDSDHGDDHQTHGHFEDDAVAWCIVSTLRRTRT